MFCEKSISIKLVSCDNNSVTAVILNVFVKEVHSQTLLVSVYMPVDVSGNHSNEEFVFITWLFQCHDQGYQRGGYYFLGRFYLSSQLYALRLYYYSLHVYNAVSAQESYPDSNSFTYVNDCHSTALWLDYVQQLKLAKNVSQSNMDQYLHILDSPV